MIQDNTSSNKIKENKYKILRMSLLLGNGEEKEETITNFEDASREIDAMNDEIYLNDLEKKFYDTLTLEEEEKKLASLVDYIGGRIEQRLSLLSDFSNVTGYELMNLPPIKYYDKLDEYKERLKYIREYLDNTNNINILNKEISEIENTLNDAYVSKATSERQNEKDEAELLKKFNNIITKVSELKDVNLSNIDSKLNDTISLVEDSKKSLEIFDKSFATLNQAGISREEEEEYLSYVNSAKDIYYSNKEQEYLLRLYILFNTSESDYNKLLTKRDTINHIIYDRMELRKELKIKTTDPLNDIYDLLEKQYDNIKKQQDNIESIEILANQINEKKDQVIKLETENQKVEILSLLKEFCIIDTYEGMEETNTELPLDNTDIISSENNIDSLPNFDSTIETLSNQPEFQINESTNDSINNVIDNTIQEKEELSKTELDTTDAKENQVIAIYNAKKINIEAATQKSNNVMKRVGEMLGVKADKPKIVSVEEKKETKLPQSNPEPNKSSESNKIEAKPLAKESSNATSALEELIGSNNNIFTNTTFDADPETNSEISSLENPLFTGNTVESESKTENPLFNSELGTSTIDDIMTNNKLDINLNSTDDFWYSQEDTPLDLNSLPDLSTSNDTFFQTSNNSMPELEFPNLDIDFDEEVK